MTQGARDRAAIARDLQRGLRAKDRAMLRELRARITAARVAKRAGVRAARAQCRDARTAYSERARELRAQLNAQIAAARDAGRQLCGRNVDAAKRDGSRRVASALHEWEDSRRLQREVRQAEGRARKDRAKTTRARAAESDDEVRANIPADLVPVFDKRRGKIRGSARRTRTEAFLEWAAEHPSIVYEIQEAEHHAELQRMERQAAQLERTMQRRDRYTRGARATARDLDEIPF